MSLQRLIVIAQAVQAHRFGILLPDLVDEVQGLTGRSWHLRTIRRDVDVLQCCGLASCVDNRVRWIGRGGFFEQPAEAAGVARDLLARSRPLGSEVA